jgi:hypothetical protein
MTAAAELAAVRAVARRLSAATAPIDSRTATALGRALATSAGSLGRAVEHLRAEAEGRLPEVTAPDDGYEGMTLAEAAARFASVAARLAVEGRQAGELLDERYRFLRAVDALSGPPRPARARGVAAISPTVNGAGSARHGGSEASTRAALAVLPKTGNQRRRILDAIAAVARDPRTVGLTDVQLAHTTGLSPNSVRPRRGELVAGGWLEAAPTPREHHGTEHTVWVLTQKAAGTAELWSATGAA